MSRIKTHLICLLLCLVNIVISQVPGLPSVRSGPCFIRPPACLLNCQHGYSWGFGNSCLCLCYIDPCTNTLCSNDQVCVVNNGLPQCVSRIITGIEVPRPTAPLQPTRPLASSIAITIGECPRLDGGSCFRSCQSDSNCPSGFKCCHNGCGFECVRPVQVEPVKSRLPIMPIGSSRPLPSGRGYCKELATAVKKLPLRELISGYIPVCMENGDFDQVQCDHHFCWCVHQSTGIEQLGSKVSTTLKDDLDCKETKRCSQQCDDSKCPQGFKTDNRGCPLKTCDCKDLCEDVQCTDKYSECQLQLSTCRNPPCPVIPTCFVNPCVHGLKRMSNGATALCKNDNQCGRGFWCHQIGFEALGFCCADPETARRPGHCENKVLNGKSNCQSNCKVDSDCDDTDKCCFDGCSLKCMAINRSNHQSSLTVSTTTTSKVSNKEALVKFSQCSLESSLTRASICKSECETDGDCNGLKRCCVQGCSKLCAYPKKTSNCLHDAITADLYRLRHQPKCSLNGQYENVQCNNQGCFCVRPRDGQVISGTLVPQGQSPECGNPKACSSIQCSQECNFGSELNSNGCPTCRCKNPCHGISCTAGNICVMADVDCIGNGECSQQPRCVPNVCHPQPATNYFGLVEQCSTECPAGFKCQSIGLPGMGGLCCPQIIGIVFIGNKGQCPSVSVNLDSNAECRIECNSDSECNVNEKCCFQGCGMTCTPVISITSQSIDAKPNFIAPMRPNVPERTRPTFKKEKDRVGSCPNKERRDNCKSGRDECSRDGDCGNVKKCCFDGCFKQCMYSEVTSSCLHLKAAFDILGQKDRIQCDEFGNFKPIQCNDVSCWCVDEEGLELSGTRMSSQQEPECDRPLECPLNFCSKKCPHGYVKDRNGCDACECYNPCLDVQCPHPDQICITEPVKCLSKNCLRVPKCVPNVCKGRVARNSYLNSVITCQSEGECPDKSSCRQFGLSEGICCSRGFHQSPGECPSFNLLTKTSKDCRTQCREDSDCQQSGDKCCFNGCGSECVSIERSTDQPEKSRPLNGAATRSCPEVRDLGEVVCGQKRVNQCSQDSDCKGSMSCCFDGCAKSCVAPFKATSCLHERSATQALVLLGNNHLHKVKCDQNGGYLKVQKHGDLEFCVDERGQEIPGTRTNAGSVNCLRPRSCPSLVCSLPCQFGFELNENGCGICKCKEPCKDVHCPFDHICRTILSDCNDKHCSHIPKCIPNVCPRGDPLTVGSETKLLECGRDKQQCPPGWSCKQFGYEDIGYCCAGITSDSSASCPSVPSVFSTNSKSRVRRLNCKGQCEENVPCCFDGLGTNCVGGGKTQFLKEEFQQIAPVKSSKPVTPAFHGTCPANIFQNPGCQNECGQNSDCPQFQQCCEFGCGRRCMFPEVSTSCVHRLAAVAEEIIKYAQLKDVLSVEFDVNQTVKCEIDGLYSNVQCDKESSQCFCVNRDTGAEIVGTRTSANSRDTICGSARSCPFECTEVARTCEHGLRLDKTGCPLNGRCECFNPCEKFKCVVPGDVCVLTPVRCQSIKHCPPQPTCRPQPCPASLKVLKSPFGIVINCKNNDDCGHKGECRALATSDNEEGHRVGICCETNLAGSSVTMSERKPTTSLKLQHKACDNYKEAILTLHSNGVLTRISLPYCEAESGLFAKVQCDAEGSCWCADRYNGIEIVGTRALHPIHDVCTESRKDCVIQCTLDEVNACPFGLDLNSEGCPKTSQCKCKNPCDYIKCNRDEMCLLRPKSCDESSCLPVPVCESNPCGKGEVPLKEVGGVGHQTCFNNFTRPCPGGHYCSGLDENQLGFCCPVTTTSNFNKLFDDINCPHGPVFVTNGAPTMCSTVESNSCPSTHYCVAATGQNRGLCCPTKRFVCNLELDIGSCNRPVSRHYFDPDTQSCNPFMYGGCEGNLNNFHTEKECHQFCQGLAMDGALNDDAVKYYHVGFTFTGPLMRSRHTENFTNELKKFFVSSFAINKEDIRDMLVRDDNSVRFNVLGKEAEEKADQITKAIETGQVYFRYGDETYHAEPTTFFAHLVDANSSPKISGFLFWVLLVSSAVVALVVVIALFCACYIVKNRTKDTGSVIRGVSPSPYGQISAFLAPDTPNQSPKSSRLNVSPKRNNAYSVDDVRVSDSDQPSDSRPHKLPSLSGPQTHGGRRPSRTTLYY